MSPDNDTFQRWKHVLAIAESMDEDAKQGRLGREDLRDYLATIEEVFASADPLEEFQGFALLELCRALRRASSAS